MSDKVQMTDRDRFFITIVRDGAIDDGAIEFLLHIVGECSSRLPPEGRASIVYSDGGASELAAAIDTPACIFVEELVKRFVGKCASLTALIEYDHIDPTYRDMYYRHYAHEFFNADRFSLRVNFFGMELSQFSYVVAGDDELQESFIGSCVIGSLDGRGSIGRTLVNPSYLVEKSSDIRLSEFHINVAGRKLEVRAFPFRGQDGAMMRCAEVTLLNLMCYYSNEYSDYHQALPSEIAAHEQMYSNERVIPSRGLSYDKLTKILSDFRFFPRLYNVDSVGSSVSLGVDLPKEVLFHRLLHWYVGSGIPVAMNVGRPKTDDDGHSIICIGYEDIHAPLDRSCASDGHQRADGGGGCQFVVDSQISEHSIRVLGRPRRKSPSGGKPVREAMRSFQLICGADFDRDLVVVDDGMVPYALVPYSEPSSVKGFECLNYAVALHRSMAMDALDAYENAIVAMGHPELGVLTWGNDYLDDGETLVFDMFMASVRGYKRDRVGFERERYREAKETEGPEPVMYGVSAEEYGIPMELTEAEWHVVIANTIGTFAMPRFLWIVEISRLSEYKKPRGQRRVFAELVFDATSGGTGEVVDKIVLMRYPDKIYLRGPDGICKNMPVGIGPIDRNPIRPYSENLDECDPILGPRLD